MDLIVIEETNEVIEVAQGIPGVGVPRGGSTGQALIKLSDADYDLGFGSVAGGGGGAVTSVAGRTGVVVLSKSDVGLANVDNTADANKPVSTPQAAALANKSNVGHTHVAANITDFNSAVDARVQNVVGAAPAALDTLAELSAALGNDANYAATMTAQLATKAPIANPTFTGTVSGVTKAMVGLTNVDNTSDINKPLSTAEQAALALKANLASPTFTGTVGGITKSMVGLGNVDNTADTAKNFVASQIVSGVLATARLGAGIADSTTYLRGDGIWATVAGGGGGSATLSGLTDVSVASPVSGNFLRHNGTAWTNAVASKADVGLANVDNTSDVNKPVSTATTTALALKANLASPTFTGTVSGVTKAMVGLGNVDNTADAAKAFAASQITSGILAIAQIPTGTTSATVALGNHTHTTYVGLTGNETVAGIKTFTSAPVVPANSFTISNVVTLQDSLDAKASAGVGGLPGGVLMFVNKTAGTWPARPTNRTDIKVVWQGADPPPAIVASGTGGMLDNQDVNWVIA